MQVVQAAHSEVKSVGMGGMAGDPESKMRHFPAGIRKLQEILADVLKLGTAGEIRAAVEP